MTMNESAPLPRWLLPAFLTAAAAFLVALAIDNETFRVAVKAIPVLILTAAVWTHSPRTRYRELIAVGLLFGAGGDLLLELDLFVFGLGSFLIGHLFYIPAFLRDERRFGPKELLPYAAWAVALIASLADGAGDMLIPGAAYIIVLGAMAWRALVRMGSVPGYSGVATAVGAALFAFSDSLIAINRFGPEIPGARWYIITTYFVAQFLIASGAIRRPD